MCIRDRVSVSFYFGAEPLFRVFTQDNNVVAVGVQMMHVLTPVYITYILSLIHI